MLHRFPRVAGVAFLLVTGSAFAQDLLHEHFAPVLVSSNLLVEAVGDVDGDGVSDFAMAIPVHGGGTVLVISGATQTPLHTFVSDAQTGSLGNALANVGDVDLDGVADLAVSSSTSVTVYSLGAGQRLYTIQGTAGDRFGFVLAPAGDVDGDGRADFAVGAPQVTVWGGGDSWHIAVQGPGFVQVHSGRDGSLVRTLANPTHKSGFGGSIACGGDLDGDGIPDLLVSHDMRPALFVSNTSVHAFSGASGTAIFQAPLFPQYGSVGPLGDVDGDGTDDFVLGGLFGSVRAVSGRTQAVLYARDGIGPYDSFGISFAPVGDLDGDSFPELLVGATQPLLYSPWGSIPNGTGYARILSGRTGTVLQTLVGDFESQYFGSNVAALGDVDADGTADFLITTRINANDRASVRVYGGAIGYSAPTNYCVGNWNVTGNQASIGFQGSSSISANQLSMTLSGAVPGQVGILLAASTPSVRRFEPYTLTASPYLCVGPDARRLSGPLPISSQGTLTRAVDLGPTSPFLVGSTWYFQFAYFATPSNLDSSDGLAVTFTP